MGSPRGERLAWSVCGGVVPVSVCLARRARVETGGGLSQMRRNGCVSLWGPHEPNNVPIQFDDELLDVAYERDSVARLL